MIYINLGATLQLKDNYTSTMLRANKATSDMTKSISNAQAMTGEMTKSTSQLNSQMKYYKAELRNTMARIDDTKNSTAALQAKADSYNKRIGVQRQLLDSLNDKYREVARTKGENSTEAIKLATSIQRAQAEEARMENQLEQTNRAIRDQSSAWRRMRREYDQAKADEAPGSRFKMARGAGTAAMGAGAAMTLGLGAAVKTAADFESQMSRVEAISGATASEFTKMQATAKELGRTTEFSATQAAEGMQYLSMAGFNAKQSIEAMPGMLNMASAAQMDLGRAADISSNILSAFSLKAEEMGRVGDVLTKAFTSSNVTLEMLGNTMEYVGPIAQAAGFSLEEMSAAAGILGDKGIQSQKAGTALRATITRLTDPPKEAAAAMEELGLEITDAEGNMLPLADILEQTKKGMEDMSESQRTAIASQLAGTEAASAFLALVETGPDKLKEFTTELENSGGAAEEIAEKQLDNLTGSTKEMMSALKTAAITAGSVLSPAIRTAVDAVKSAFNWFNDLNPTMQQVISIAAAVTAGASLLGGALLFVVGVLPTVTAALGALGISAGTAALVLGGIPVLIGAVAAAGVLLVKNWGKIKTAATDLWDTVSNTFKKGVNFVIEMLNWLIEKINVLPGFDIDPIDKLYIKNTESYNPMAHGRQAHSSTPKGSPMAHASGLPYVPYDNYPAMLHKGEAVLPRTQADDYRESGKKEAQKIFNITIQGMNKTVREIFEEIMDIAEEEDMNTGQIVFANE